MKPYHHFPFLLMCIIGLFSCGPTSGSKQEASQAVAVPMDSLALARLSEQLSCGHDYVDLGICNGLKWATMNVGATQPEQAGYFFAWGDTCPHGGDIGEFTFSELRYRFGYPPTKYLDDPVTVYDNKIFHMVQDHKITLDFFDDAARVHWGGGWRMPDASEFDSLLTLCTWLPDTLNDVPGYRVISRRKGYEGNSIFLPSTGCWSMKSYLHQNQAGYFWSRSLLPGTNRNGVGLITGRDGLCLTYYFRYHGQTIRPVFLPGEVLATGIQIDTTSIQLFTGGQPHQLSASIQPHDATYQQVFWGTSDRNVATVDSAGLVTPVGAGYCLVTANVVDGTGLSALCKVEVTDPAPPEHECVDMIVCNHLRWATMNVGAEAPSQLGSTFDWEQATHQMWGDHFRLPTAAEWDSLRANCFWDWTMEDGVMGYRVTSTRVRLSGSSIFLPAAQFSDVTSYWSADAYATMPSSANVISFDQQQRYWSYRPKQQTLPIRMVYSVE